MTHSDDIDTETPFSHETLMEKLGLRSESPTVHDALKILWQVFLEDGELWDKSVKDDRLDILDVLVSQVAPAIELFNTFLPTFPRQLDHRDDMLIVALCDSHIINPAFNRNDSLTKQYYKTAFCCHEGDQSDEHDVYPHRYPIALDILTQLQEAETRARKTPEGMLPEAHYLYLLYHYIDCQECIETLQDTDFDYDEKRQLVDELKKIDPAFLLDNDSLPQSIIEAEGLISELRPKKASLHLVTPNRP